VTETKKRYFTESELKEMGAESVKLIEKAIDAGDLEKAKKLAHRMYSEYLSTHNIFWDWLISTLGFIQEELGDEAVYRSMYRAFESLTALADAYRNQDAGQKAKLLAAGFRGHLTPVVVEEDDEKFTIMMTPCGSGGRAIASKGYETGKFAKIKKPQKMTFGKKDFPIYCAHCALQDIIPMETGGYPLWVMEDPGNVGVEPCKFYIYKNPDDIPVRFYERFGLKKPAPKSTKYNS